MAFSASRLSCELQDCLHLLKYTKLFADTCVFSHCKLCLVEKLEKINFLFFLKKRQSKIVYCIQLLKRRYRCPKWLLGHFRVVSELSMLIIFSQVTIAWSNTVSNIAVRIILHTINISQLLDD